MLQERDQEDDDDDEDDEDDGVDPMHPDGRCTCSGEGRCEWCRTHCLWCGVKIDHGWRDCGKCS